MGLRLSIANDTLIFYDTCQEQLTFLNRSLTWFVVVSTLKINVEKSKLIPIEDA